METKFEIVETNGYILAIAKENKQLDKEKSKNEYYLAANNEIHRLNETNLLHFKGKIVGQLPLTAPALDGIPYLPYQDDYIETLAHNYLNKNYEYVWDEGDVNTFKAGYKAATKEYSKDDIIGILLEYLTNQPEQTLSKAEFVRDIMVLIKQPNPKWFIAETEKHCWCMKPMRDGCSECNEKLKLIFKNGKITLNGRYES